MSLRVSLVTGIAARETVRFEIHGTFRNGNGEPPLGLDANDAGLDAGDPAAQRPGGVSAMAPALRQSSS